MSIFFYRPIYGLPGIDQVTDKLTPTSVDPHYSLKVTCGVSLFIIMIYSNPLASLSTVELHIFYVVISVKRCDFIQV